ncbi:MAG: adenylate kinase [Bacteroidetes bacterium]|nr:adenylate kinase [Bacteroidota bacterium]
MQIIFLGSPGVGKGTQAKILSKKLNITHISTGDMLREAISHGTEVGLKAKEIVDKGELVPDDLMGQIVKEILMEDKCKNGFILDGFPRTLNQAVILGNIFEELNIPKPCLIHLEVDPKIIIERLSNRLACSNCKNIISLSDLKDTTVCPVCNSKNTLIKRKDDEEEVVKKRLNVYKETTEPVIHYYKERAYVVVISGVGSLDEVSDRILKALAKCKTQ